MTGALKNILHVPAADGVLLPIHQWLPRVPIKHAVMALHGATSHGGWFDGLARELAAAGVATYAPDRRGSGLLLEHGLPATADVWLDDLRRVVVEVGGHGPTPALIPWCFSVKLALPALAQGLPVHRALLFAPAFHFHPSVAAGFEKALAQPEESFPTPAPDGAFVESEHALAFLGTDPLRWPRMSKSFVKLSRALMGRTLEALPNLRTHLTGVFAARDRIVDNPRGRSLLVGRGDPILDVAGSHGFFMDEPEPAAALVAAWLDGGPSAP